MSDVADRILMLPPLVALLLVFALPALEASAFVGFIIPGEIGVILGGVLANQHKLPLWAALVAGIAGAVIGDSVGYEIGRRYGERLLQKIPNRLLKQKHIAPRTWWLVMVVGRCSSAGSPPPCGCWCLGSPGWPASLI